MIETSKTTKDIVEMEEKEKKENIADKRTQKLNLIIGLIISITSLLLIFIGVKIPGIGFTLIYVNEEMEVNLTVLLWIVLLYIGIFFITRIFANHSGEKHENSFKLEGENSLHEKLLKGDYDKLDFWSFNWSRLLCGILLLITAFIQYEEFGATFTNANGLGCWLFLGGPTLFYPTTFFNIPIGLGLILYSILSIAKITIGKSKSNYIIIENRFGIKSITEMQKDETTALHFTNAKTGPKFLWVLIFGIQIYYLAIDAFAYLLNDFTFGQGYVAGTHYMLQVIVDLFCLVILILIHQSFLEIHSKYKRYELEFMISPFLFHKWGKAKNREFQNRISNIFDIPADRNTSLENKPQNKTNKNRLIAGITFITIFILTRSLNIYGSDPLRMVLFFSGIILITKALKEDIFTSKIISEEKGFLERTELSNYFDIKYISPESSSMEITTKRTNLNDIWDWLMIISLVTLVLISLISTIILVPVISSSFISMILIQIGFASVILGLVYLAFFQTINLKKR